MHNVRVKTKPYHHPRPVYLSEKKTGGKEEGREERCYHDELQASNGSKDEKFWLFDFSISKPHVV